MGRGRVATARGRRGRTGRSRPSLGKRSIMWAPLAGALFLLLVVPMRRAHAGSGATAQSAAATADSGSVAADSAAAVPDSLAARPDTAATQGPGNAAPSAGRVPPSSALPRPRGVADTVTILPPVQVDAPRAVDAGRQTTTSVRLDRSKLVRFLPSTASDALVNIPGVDLVKTGPWSSRLSVRGLGGERVLVLVDGVRVNGVRGHGAQSSLVALDRLEAVELQPGASSAQFGSDALGGMVQFVTHGSLIDSREKAQLTVQSRGSMPNGAWSQSGRLRLVGPRLGLELGGGVGGLDALTTPGGRVANSGDREQHVSGRAVARLGAGLLDYEHARNAAYDIGLPAFSDDQGSRGVYPLQARDVDRLELTRPGRRWTPDARLLAALQTSRTHFNEITVSPWTRFGRVVGYNTADARDRVRTRALSVQPMLHWAGAGNFRLSADYRRETTSGPRNTTTTTTTTTGEVTNVSSEVGESMPSALRETWSGAASVAPEWHRVRFEAGARWDQLGSHADSTERSSTSRLDVTDRRLSVDGGVAGAWGGIEPYLHFATGFRAPNLEERYYHDEIHGGMTVFGNPDLESERSESGELGLRFRDLGPLQSGRASAYRSNVEDLISIQYLDMLYGRPRFQYRNVREARLEGLEVQLQLKIGTVGVALYGALPRGEDRATGRKLVDAGTGRATIDLSLPVARLVPNGALSLRWRWNDAVTGVDTTLARPAFSTMALELSSVLSGVRTVIAIRNLLDLEYREPLSFIPEPGRTIAVALRGDIGLRVPFFHEGP